MRQVGKRRARRARGMTLIEIMVVIALLGLIAAVVAVRVVDQAEDARRGTARLELRTLESAAQLYRVRFGRWPDAQRGIAQLAERRLIDKVPVDPWGHAYVYAVEGDEPVFRSLGADGEPGGEGRDADVMGEAEAAEQPR